MSSALTLEVCGVTFKNPLIAASGTFGYGIEMSNFTDLNKIGGISVKGLSIEPCAGNPMPRICETSSGMINSIGLENIGVRTFICEKLPLLRRYDTRVIANFWGRTKDEYIAVAEILDNSDIDMLEMNISCPNIKEGGISFSSSPQAVRSVVTDVVNHIKNKPLIVKLSPNVTDIKSYALACEDSGASAVSAINTLVGMAIDINTKRPKVANNIGGLSGAAIKPVGIKAVYDVCKAVKIPVIGIGGIMSAEDVIEYALAGASLVQIGSANFINHNVIAEIQENLMEYCINNSVSYKNLIGEVRSY